MRELRLTSELMAVEPTALATAPPKAEKAREPRSRSAEDLRVTQKSCFTTSKYYKSDSNTTSIY